MRPPLRLAAASFTALAGVAAMAAVAPQRPAAAAPDGAPGDAPRAPAADAPSEALVPVEKFFRGKVQKVDGHRIELLYDFQDPGQLADFTKVLAYRAILKLEAAVKSGRLDLDGTGTFRHSAVFDGEAGISATLVPRRPRDFGFAVTEERESEVFTLYCCYDRYFGRGDNVHVPQNMIIKFLARDSKANKDGLQDWRYCGSRGQNPEIVSGKSYRVSARRTGMESRMTIGDDWESKGKETGRDLTAMQVALYVHDSHVEADDLIIAGVLDKDFVTRSRIDLTSWKPPPKEPAEPAGPAAPAVSDAAAERFREKVVKYPLETKPAALAQMLRDTAVPASLRAEAAEKAKTTGAKRIVPFLVEGLYSDDLDARRLSFDVLKTLLGKSFNYRPDGTEETRKRAIRDINEYLQKHPEEFV